MKRSILVARGPQCSKKCQLLRLHQCPLWESPFTPKKFFVSISHPKTLGVNDRALEDQTATHQNFGNFFSASLEFRYI